MFRHPKWLIEGTLVTPEMIEDVSLCEVSVIGSVFHNPHKPFDTHSVKQRLPQRCSIKQPD